MTAQIIPFPNTDNPALQLGAHLAARFGCDAVDWAEITKTAARCERVLAAERRKEQA
jgi:hypothetical protein